MIFQCDLSIYAYYFVYDGHNPHAKIQKDMSEETVKS